MVSSASIERNNHGSKQLDTTNMLNWIISGICAELCTKFFSDSSLDIMKKF